MKENMLLYLKEEVLPIIGYEGLYSVTSKGRIYSHEKIVKCRNNSDRVLKAKFLNSQLDKDNYLTVSLYINNKKKTHKVHRLVATAFIENPQNHPEVNHKDGVKTNNNVSNLEWCNHQGNHNHASKNGLKFKFHSEFYGVTYNKGKIHINKPWFARTTINKKLIHIGSYKTEIEAALAYNEYVTKNNLDRPLNKFNEV